MESQVKTVGIFWIVYGGLGLLIGLCVFAFFLGMSFLPEDQVGSAILRILALAGGGLIFILSVPEVMAGYALLKYKEWGRILALVVSFLNVIWFPLGTALGVYSFIILTNQETVSLFQTGQTA